MAACGLEGDGHMWTCAACGHGQPRGAAAAARRRGPRPRRRARPPATRACARRRRASGRARGRRGSCLSRDAGFLAACRWRGAARSRFCLLSTSALRVEGATRRGRLGGALAALPRVAVRTGPVWAAFQGRSQRRAVAHPALHSKRRGAADVSKRRAPPTSPRAPQRQMRSVRDHAGGKR